MYEPDLAYHIYNRGNNRELIFFREENYYFFLDKMRKHLVPLADILSFCLMPNHFHLQLVVKPVGLEFGNTTVPGKPEQKIQRISVAIQSLLSSYTRAINRQEKRTGSLFQQRTKAKIGWDSRISSKLYNPNIPFTRQLPYVVACFHYIHDNPVKAGLVKNAADWPFSSAKDYAGSRDTGICNFEVAESLLRIVRSA